MRATADRQLALISTSPSVQRDTAHFKNNMAAAKSVSEFLNDPSLLRVALGAFGLSEDINNKAFIERIINDGTEENNSLSNRLADKSYREFARAFSFEKLSGEDSLSTTEIENIVQKFINKRFQEEIGKTDNNLRTAINLSDRLSEFAKEKVSPKTIFYQILGEPPLRLAFETAFGLSNSFASIDLDKQVEVLKDMIAEKFGSSSFKEFNDQRNIDRLVYLFLSRATANSIDTRTTSAQIALTLIQS